MSRTTQAILYLLCMLPAISLLALGISGDLGFYWPAIIEDISKRTYILLGMAAFLLLIPLAVTSSNRMIQRLGYPRWKQLHRLVYPASILVAAHYLLLVKADRITAAAYAIVLAILLLVRVWWWWKSKYSLSQG